jgi:hypothetical protein
LESKSYADNTPNLHSSGNYNGSFWRAEDYAMLVKIYGADRVESEARYSPAECMGRRTIPITGNPKARDISTSYVERQNLTMRMQMRRFTRLTNAFSKKIDNLGYAVALHFMHYNFCRVHQLYELLQPWRPESLTMSGQSTRLWNCWGNGMKKRQPKNSEASPAAGLAPEFRRTRGDKLVVLDYGAPNWVSRKLTKIMFDLIMSVSA